MLTVEEMQDICRNVIGAVTAVQGDDEVALLEALRLLGATDGVVNVDQLIAQYEITIATLLQMAAGMIALAGGLQRTFTAEEIIQRLALTLEKRWTS